MKGMFLSGFLFLALMGMENVYAQYTARVEVVEEWLVNPSGGHELNVIMRADLYDNGVLVPPQPHFQYNWWRKTNRPGATFEDRGVWTGYNEHGTHTIIDNPQSEFYLMWYLCVINGGVGSDTIMIPWWRTIADQKAASGSSYSIVRYWKDDRFTSHHEVPDTFYTPQHNESIVLQADTNLNPSRTEKYHRWFGNWNNHSEFGTGQLFTSYTSQFQASVAACTIRTHLIDAPNFHGGIQFKDPWFRDTSNQYGAFNRGLNAILRTGTSPIAPNTNPSGSGSEYQGVFLNQGFASSVYYSVGAPNPNTISGFTSYFVNWEGSNVQYQNASAAQTGVVFTASGATATAKYKAHLASSSVNAIANNTQRKIVRDSYGHYHMVYESAQHIWYTKSTDDGATWSGEKLVSLGIDPPAINRSPSITFQDVPLLLLVVWEAYAAEGSDYQIGVLSSAIDLQGNITDQRLIDSWSNSSAQETRPVIASGITLGYDRFALAAYYDGRQNRVSGSVRRATSGDWSTPSALRQNTYQFSLAPFSGRGYSWHFTWLEQGELRYAPIEVSDVPQEVSLYELVAKASLSSYNQDPTIVTHRVDRQPGIAFVENAWEFDTRLVRHKQRYPHPFPDDAAWDSYPSTVWSSGTSTNLYSPSLSGNLDLDNAVLTFRDGTTALHTHRASPWLEWEKPEAAIEGYDPVLSVGSSSVDNAVLAVRWPGTLQAINTTTVPTGGSFSASGPTGTIFGEGRGGVLHFGNGMLRLAVVRVELDSLLIMFSALRDTVPIRTLAEFEQGLTTEQFNGGGTLNVRIHFATSGDIPNGAHFRVVLRDGQRRILQELRRFENVRDTIMSFSVAIPRNGREKTLGIEAYGIGTRARYELERWYTTQVAAPAQAAILAKRATETVIPEVFAIHASYPNPFNPTTTIKFDLPEQSHVSLIVYDVLGRQVAELKNGVKDAGYHSATWQGSDIASGVYFARFTATDLSGNLKLSKVSKLLLAK